MNVQAITVIVICFASGFIIVHYVWRATAGWLRQNGGVGANRDYHRRVLGVEEGASFADLKAAYESRILKYDPEKFRDFGPEFQDLSRERTKDIEQAYAHLRQTTSGEIIAPVKARDESEGDRRAPSS